MRREQDILRAHYGKLARRFLAFGGVAAVLSTAFVALPARAQQITNRSVNVVDNSAGASTTYDINFRPAQGVLTRAIKFQMCTSPLELTSCTASNSSSFNSASFSSASPTTSPFTSNCAQSNRRATDYVINYTTGDTLSNATTYTVRLTGVVNPNVTNTSYYVRIYTYSDAAATTPNQIDFGAVALSTANKILNFLQVSVREREREREYLLCCYVAYFVYE